MSIKEDGFFKALFSVLDTALETQSFQVAILHFCIFSFLLETSGRINGFIFDVFASGGRVNQSINAEDLGWFCRHRVHCFHARVQRRFLFPLVARQQFSQNYSWGNAETTVIHRLESNPAIHLLYNQFGPYPDKKHAQYQFHTTIMLSTKRNPRCFGLLCLWRSHLKPVPTTLLFPTAHCPRSEFGICDKLRTLSSLLSMCLESSRRE